MSLVHDSDHKVIHRISDSMGDETQGETTGNNFCHPHDRKFLSEKRAAICRVQFNPAECLLVPAARPAVTTETSATAPQPRGYPPPARNSSCAETGRPGPHQNPLPALSRCGFRAAGGGKMPRYP